MAWRSTARDFSIKWEDIAREAGLDEVEVACLQEYSTLHPLPERDMTPDELCGAIETYTFDNETVTVVDACHAQNMHESNK